MTWSQMLVVTWIEFILAACLLLFLARRSLSRLPQPVDRIRLILFSLTAATTLPLLLTLAPWTAWRLQVIAPMEGQTVRVESEAPVHSGPADIISPDRLYSQQPWDMPPTPLDVAPAADQAPAAHDFPQAATVIASTPSARWTSNDVWAGAAWAILGLHGLALLVYLGQSSIGAFQLRRWRREAALADEPLAQIWSTLTTGSARQVQLLVTPAIDVPLMFGWWRPVVLIPQTLAERGGPVVRYCLAHEWAHIARGDMVAWRWVRLCQILFWLIPSYWKLRKELRLCQDLLADQCSTGAAGDAVEYSELLVGFARQRMSARVAGALTFLDHPSQLTRRIKMLLECPISVRFQCTWRFSILAAVAAGLFAVVISGVRIEARQGQKDLPPDEQPDQKHITERKESIEKPVEKPAEKLAETSAADNPAAVTYLCSIVDKETGKGIPNARVVVRRWTLSMPEDRIRVFTRHTTDAQGKYVIDIPAEQVAEPSLQLEIEAEHENYAALNRAYLLARIIRREKEGIRPQFERMELHPGEAVTGIIESPDGRPLADVPLQSYWIMPSRRFDSSSFHFARTDGQGRFRLAFPKQADAVLWVAPQDFAVVEKFLGNERGEMGVIRLSPGIRVDGRVLSVEGKPIPQTVVNIEYIGERSVGSVPVATNLCRGTFTDAEGRFSFDPVPPGEYRIQPEAYLTNHPNRGYYPVPGAFRDHQILLKEGVDPGPQEIQALPHVEVRAKFVDSAGNATQGHQLALAGKLDGQRWQANTHPVPHGTFTLLVPHGLQEPDLRLVNNELRSQRYCLGAGQPLVNMPGEFMDVSLETMNDDVEIEIIRYRAPVVLISAVDTNQQPIREFHVTATYPWGKQPITLAGGLRSDLVFDKESDGRYRAARMLPDEDVTLTVRADGYEPVSEKLNLKEGETTELAVTLRKTNEQATRQGAKTAGDLRSNERRGQETLAEQSKTRAEQKVAASDREKSAEKADTPDVPKKEEPVTLTYMCSVVDRETGKGISNARVTVRRSILTAQENRILEESKHTTDAEGKYEVVIPPEQVATPWLYIELDVVHDDYAWKKGFGYALSMIRKNEKLGERPFFERTELYPGEAVSGTVVSPDGKPLEGVLALGYSRGNRRDFESGSFTEAKTAADGSFRVIFHKGVDAVLWVIPKEHAPVHQFVARQRGDLGVIEVSTGIRVAGRVVGVDGKAIAGAPVNVEFAGEQNVGDLPVGTSIQRAALSDADGRFQLDPLPAGEYRVTVEEHLADPLARDRTRYSVSEVFLPKKIVLKEGVEQALLEVQAVPHIVIHAQNLDSAGKRTKGHEFHLFGQLDGESWFGQGKPNLDGTAVLNVPHGLQEAQMQLVANEHGALRYRRGKDQPLQDDVSRIRLGTLNDDIEDFEIIYYKAPIALVSAVDEAQQQIPKLQVKATYARPRPDAYIAFENKSDIYFEHQKDGKYRTRQMLPDEDVTITVTAEGYGSVEERINLKEGETKELVVTLRKNADNESR